MKLKQFWIVALLLITLNLWGKPTGYWNEISMPDSFGRGHGTAGSPYLIESAEHLAYLAWLLNTWDGKGEHPSYGKYFKISDNVDDIDLSAHYWVPILSFMGHFDGNNKSISNLYIDGADSSGYTSFGLFGGIASDLEGKASLSGLHISSGEIYGGGEGCTGGITGTVSGSVTIENCSNNASVTGGSYVGGIVGRVINEFYSSITIKNCTNKAPITGKYITGGIIGNAQTHRGASITIENCTNKAPVTGIEDLYSYTGGIIGNADATRVATITITGCSNESVVTGGNAVYRSGTGGIVGYTYTMTGDYGAGSLIIIDCINKSTIGGGNANETYTGGIISYADYSAKLTIDNCSNQSPVTSGNTTAVSYTAGIVGYTQNNHAIANSANIATITGGDAGISYTGGIIGYATQFGSLLIIENCYNRAEINAQAGYAGGLAGVLSGQITLTYSYATGKVTGKAQYAGGLIGVIVSERAESHPVVENCLVVMSHIAGTTTHRITGGVGAPDKQSLTPEDLPEAFGLGNYASGVKGDNPVSPDGADWNGETTELKQLLTGIGWNFNRIWTIDQDGIINDGLPYLNICDYGDTYTMTIEIAVGINLYNLYAGKLTVGEGDNLQLKFQPEDRSIKAEDILFIVDGVETAFVESDGNPYFTYLFSAIREDHTVLIALKEYTVTLPDDKDAALWPGAGEYRVAYSEPFTFGVSFGNDEEMDFKVYANGIEIQSVSQGGEPSVRLDPTPSYYFFRIDRVMEPVVVNFSYDPTSNEILETSTCKLSIINNGIIVETAELTRIQVYMINGSLIIDQLVNGSETITLANGIYIVRAGKSVYKMIVR